MRVSQLLIPILGALALAGCTSLPVGFGERDKYVVNTPEYVDNRVFYVAPKPVDTLERVVRSWPLQDAWAAKTQADDAARIAHGSALSVILNSVTLPPPEMKDGKPVNQGARDIAVVLDISTKTTGGSESILAWYQRGVTPDAPLNFSNLLLYFDPRWDARVAPMIRIRVVDVTSERNAEVREALGQVKQFTSSLGPILPTATQTVVSIANRAASLVLAGRQNKQLLDYSVQFYSEEQIASSYGSDLTPLKRGRVLLIGRPKTETSSYWHDFNGQYDGETLLVNKTGSGLVTSPVVMLTVSTAQTIVPTIVAARSSYLQKLLVDAQQGDVTAVTAAGRSVWDGVRTYAVLEELRRSRDQAAVLAVYGAYKEDGEDTKLSSDDRALLRQALRDISACTLQTDEQIDTWWEDNKNTIRFAKDKLKLEGETGETCAKPPSA